VITITCCWSHDHRSLSWEVIEATSRHHGSVPLAHLQLTTDTMHLFLQPEMQFLALASQSNLTVLVFGLESKTLNSHLLVWPWPPLGLRTSAEHWPLGRSVESCASGSTVHCTAQSAWENLLCTCYICTCWTCVLALCGLFMRPHRARMGDKMLTDLVFLKRNKHVWVNCELLQLAAV